MVVTGPTDNDHNAGNISKSVNWHIGQQVMPRSHGKSSNDEKEATNVQCMSDSQTLCQGTGAMNKGLLYIGFHACNLQKTENKKRGDGNSRDREQIVMPGNGRRKGLPTGGHKGIFGVLNIFSAEIDGGNIIYIFSKPH